MATRLSVTSEYGRLQAVLMASPRYFRPASLINVTQERWFPVAPPQVDSLLEEQGRFAELLATSDVEIYWAPELPECPYQLNTRDIGAVVGDCLIEGRMRFPIRSQEPQVLRSLLGGFDGRRCSLGKGHFEGGDLLIDGNRIFVGVGERTDEDGVAQIKELGLPVSDIEVVHLAPRVLHLDVVLNILPMNLALLYRPGLVTVPRVLEDEYKLIEVDRNEQERLACNVFCLDCNTVVMDERNGRIAELLREHGMVVHTLPLAETTKSGGSFRCMTLPLLRE
jgi:N-dimethylarginine dimethylaminohydrolase